MIKNDIWSIRIYYMKTRYLKGGGKQYRQEQRRLFFDDVIQTSVNKYMNCKPCELYIRLYISENK